MHLKNFSMVRNTDGIYKLSPAYDLLSTCLYIPGDQLALSVGAKRKNLTRRTWLGLAAYGGIPEKAAVTVLAELGSVCAQAVEKVSRSGLPDELRDAYADTLLDRAKVLTEGAGARKKEP